MASNKPTVAIHYCPKCKWLARAAWMAQELLTTFEDELGAVTLVPAEQSGLFQVYVNENLTWDRKTNEGFPQIKQLKQLVRDAIAPQKELGHIDK